MMKIDIEAKIGIEASNNALLYAYLPYEQLALGVAEPFIYLL